MKHFVLYAASGAIIMTCSCDDQSFAGQAAPAGQTLLELAAPPNLMTFARDNWVNGGSVVARGTIAAVVSAATIAADGTAAASITGLPDPCTVSITGPQNVAPTVVNGGSISVTCNSPGTITVNVTADPAYLPWSAAIDAV